MILQFISTSSQINSHFNILQLFTSVYFVFLVMNTLIATVKAVCFIFEINSPTFVNYFQIFVSVFAVTFIMLTLVEYCLFKLWIEFVWKSVRPTNDQFLVFFLQMSNLTLGLMVTVSNIILEMSSGNSILSQPGFWIEKYSSKIK